MARLSDEPLRPVNFANETSVKNCAARLARKCGYPARAIEFVMRGTHFFLQSTEVATAEHVLWYLRDFAIALHGRKAIRKLQSWSITSAADLGAILELLGNEKVFQFDDDFDFAFFRGAFNFEAAFELPQQAKQGFQFRISTLLILTTLAAAVVAGINSHGLAGVLGALYGCWLMVIGGYCMHEAIVKKPKGRIVQAVIGILFLAAGVVMIGAVLFIRDPMATFTPFTTPP